MLSRSAAARLPPIHTQQQVQSEQRTISTQQNLRSCDMADWVAQGCALGVRDDGRDVLDVRRTVFETGVLVGCTGSAHVKRGACDVVAGVKLELAPPVREDKEGELFVRVDVTCSLQDEKRTREQEGDLSRCRESSLGGDVIDRVKLCIVPGADGLAWNVYVDVVVLGDGGSLLDVCSLAVRAALARTRLPKVTPFRSALLSKWDFSVEEDMCDAVPLDVSRVPVMITVSVFGGRAVLDATSEEQARADAALVAALSLSGQLTFSRMTGRGGMAPQLLFAALATAKEAAAVAVRTLDAALRQEEEQQRPKTWLVQN